MPSSGTILPDAKLVWAEILHSLSTEEEELGLVSDLWKHGSIFK